MDTLIRMKVDDINASLIDFLRQSFKGRKIEFHVLEEAEEMDETEFVLRDPIARERILKAVESINQNNNLKEYTLEEFNDLLNDAEKCEKIILEPAAIEDIYFFGKNDSKLLRKIAELMNAIAKEPFTGVGKPEPLRGNLQGFWSRRINDEHRLIYKITSEAVLIASFRSHYDQ